MSDMTIKEALQIAREEVKDIHAQTYLKAIPIAVEEYGTAGFKVQILYALNNMKTWRGETARKVKAVLKAYAKSKST